MTLEYVPPGSPMFGDVPDVLDALRRTAAALGVSFHDLSQTVQHFGAATHGATEAFRAFTRVLDGQRLRLRIARYMAEGRTRPDGRPRRSGHRHRGTAAWERRHG